ncbi:DNA cytosine methyltransferase [Rhodoferax ferrireducens]|uniref:DNA cytosine methyltransferase n=1 Tax=Rhodoferax ferrireducens TaxID=192843 RepID=UPI00298E5203|nr:DNA cytosine methyltransferase [Rhodoferax ferrireducens]WPC68023.1 DNA cytosine methyltransferase [Rhodoferax ferrireducens]
MFQFIDLFAGCGGLSLGLTWAGAQGRLAIERDPMAFSTFAANLLDATDRFPTPFLWPDEYKLERKAWAIDDFLKESRSVLVGMAKDGIDIIAGGPPCQGFSFAGKRKADDPRNQLFKRYLEVVQIVRPRAVLIENVPGMAVRHDAKYSGLERGRWDPKGSAYEVLASELETMNYDVEAMFIDASEFGVPQRRTRLIIVGMLKGSKGMPSETGLAAQVFSQLEKSRSSFLRRIGITSPISAKDAIGDLSIHESSEGSLVPYEGEGPKNGFMQLKYDGRRCKTPYQRWMHQGVASDEMDSMRFARHSELVRDRFQFIITNCRQGVRMDEKSRESLSLRKHRIHPMAAAESSPTLTTLPEDVLHYADPRILTVREYARLQSFPDWFKFKGKYTTGGNMRVRECPRYTQVGNAVPPLLSWALAEALTNVLNKALQ